MRRTLLTLWEKPPAKPLAVSAVFSARPLLVLSLAAPAAAAVGLIGAVAPVAALGAAAAPAVMVLVNCVPEVPLPARLSQNRADPLKM